MRQFVFAAAVSLLAAFPALAGPSDAAVQVWHKNARGSGAGSGTVVACEGGRSLVLTNRHVCPVPEAGPRIHIATVEHKGRKYPARFLGCDPVADLAALLVTAELPAAELWRVEPPAGVPVEQWGHPFAGPARHKTGTTQGYTGADHRTGAPVYRTDAVSQPGDSGSGVFHRGKVAAVLWGGNFERDPVTGEVVAYLPGTACVGLSDVRRFLRGKADLFPKFAESLTADDESNDCWEKGCRDSWASGKPLVAYVGREGHPVSGAEVCAPKNLEGYAPGDVVVSLWVGDRHVGKKFDGDPTDPVQVDKFAGWLRANNK